MAEPEGVDLDRAIEQVEQPLGDRFGASEGGRHPVMGPDEPDIGPNGAREAAFFDLDKTLLPGAALWPLAQELYREKVLTARDIARMLRDQLRYRLTGSEHMGTAHRVRDASLEAVRGRPQTEIIQLGRNVALAELLPRLYPQAVELINRHKRAGREVYLCSASPEDYLRVLAKELDMDGVVGTRAEVVNGLYTGRILGELCHGEEKARRVAELAARRGINLGRSFAYSDSVNDLPMLELVGFPVAMNPDRSLHAIARREGWQRLDLRTARRRTLIASWAGGVAAAAGAIGYTVGYLVGRSRQVPAAAA
jgi:HAD superfamily hydrolase (TIGR01490 family)